MGRFSNLILANSGWKVVYNIKDRYYVEDIIAYVMLQNGLFYELIPLTLLDLHSSQAPQDYALKDGYIGLITPQNEFVINELLVDNLEQINISKVKEALKKNRFKLD